MNSTENLISFLREKIDVLNDFKQRHFIQLSYNQKAINDLDHYLSGPSDQPILLLGGCGSGKTHIAADRLASYNVVSPHVDMAALLNYADHLAINPDSIDLNTIFENFQGVHIQAVDAATRCDVNGSHRKWLELFGTLAKQGFKVILDSDIGSKISLQKYLLVEIPAPEYPETVLLAKNFFKDIFNRAPHTEEEVRACEGDSPAFNGRNVRGIERDIRNLFLMQKWHEQLKIMRVNCHVSECYHNHLMSQRYDSPARLWLTERGIGKEAIEIFSIGLSLETSQLIQKLKDDEISCEYAVMAKIISQKDDGSYRNLLSERLIFPIEDIRGRKLSFAARNFQRIPGPKYIGPINHLAFEKKNRVFGLKQAMKYIVESRQVIVVDGILDMIALYMSGVKNVVSIMGMTLHPNQARILKELNSEVICWFTDNTLGWQSMYHAMAMLRNQEVNVRGVKVFCKFSPRTYVQRAGPQAARKRIEKAKTFEKLFNCDRPIIPP